MDSDEYEWLIDWELFTCIPEFTKCQLWPLIS